MQHGGDVCVRGVLQQWQQVGSGRQGMEEARQNSLPPSPVSRVCPPEEVPRTACYLAHCLEEPESPPPPHQQLQHCFLFLYKRQEETAMPIMVSRGRSSSLLKARKPVGEEEVGYHSSQGREGLVGHGAGMASVCHGGIPEKGRLASSKAGACLFHCFSSWWWQVC